MMWLRHLVAIAVLGFSVAVLIPLWLARRFGVALALGSSVLEVAAQLAGTALLALGLVLWASSSSRARIATCATR